LLELNVFQVDEQICELRDFCNEDAEYKMINEHVVKGFCKDAIDILNTLMPYYKAQDYLYLDSDANITSPATQLNC
jgi:hypothetical protein